MGAEDGALISEGSGEDGVHGKGQHVYYADAEHDLVAGDSEEVRFQHGGEARDEEDLHDDPVDHADHADHRTLLTESKCPFVSGKSTETDVMKDLDDSLQWDVRPSCENDNLRENTKHIDDHNLQVWR